MPSSVIADTSCIQYLFQIDYLNLLPKLYSKIVIPVAVARELEQGRSLGVALPNIADLPWLTLSSPSLLVPSIPYLGEGEREVLSLAQNNPYALAILDDALARNYAKQLKINFTGTLGILLKCKQVGHLESLRPLCDRLNKLGFRLDASTREAVLKLAGELP